MKLRFERFEGLNSFSVRGEVSAPEIKILQIGLENMVKDLEAPLVVNLTQAKFQDGMAPVLQAIKKNLVPQTQHKIHWISTVKNVGDFPALNAFVTRLTGSKHRQIGERLQLDDQVHELHDRVQKMEARVAETSGDEQKAAELILQNQVLKAQERVLKETLHFQRERMKHQGHTASENPDEVVEKTATAIAEIKKAYGMDFNL